MQLGALIRRSGLLSHLRVSGGGDAAMAVLRGTATMPSHACFAARAAVAPGESPDDADIDLTGYRAPQGAAAEQAVREVASGYRHAVHCSACGSVFVISSASAAHAAESSSFTTTTPAADSCWGVGMSLHPVLPSNHVSLPVQAGGRTRQW